MTALQMKYEFEIGYELANLFSRNYNEKEISTLLTQAQNQIVLETIDSDQVELTNLLLKKLKVYTDDTVSPNGDFPNAYEFSVPTNCLKILHDRVLIEFNSTSPYYNINTNHQLEDVPTHTITEDYYNLNVKNPDKQPYEKLVWRMLSPSKVILIGTNEFSIEGYNCTYIKNPLPIIIQSSSYIAGDGKIDEYDWVDYTTSSLDCELDKIFHRNIVDRAVLIALEASGSQRLQTKSSIT